MKLRRATIRNYKSFNQPGEISFSSGFNVIIGQNDAGKSALLEALSTRVSYRPHRSLANAAERFAPDQPSIDFQYVYSLSRADLKGYFNSRSELYLPTHISTSHLPNPDAMQQLLKATLEMDDEFTSSWRATTGGSATPQSGVLRSWEAMDHRQTHALFRNAASPFGMELLFTGSYGSARYGTDLSLWIADSIYSFRAERLNLARCHVNGSEILLPDASNLPEVLNRLQTRHTHLWRIYLDHIRTIFPHITEVKSVVANGSQAEISISTTDPSLARPDLDFSLEHSGTGIGQVLAMLYVAIYNTQPQIILIDEPQSFLHPGALRKLFEILRQYDRHQYILTTHSPLSLQLRETDKLFQVSRSQDGSIIKEVAERDELITALSDVGARMGDVYGAESILWVEGPTEERCFPEIIRGVAKKSLHGTVIIGVLATGELEGRDARRICDIYVRLTKSNALLPKTVAFVFDREGRSERDMKELGHQLGGLMHWLPMRMYENFLLVPGAIAYVLTEIRGPSEPQVTPEEVEAWFNENGGNPKYFARDQSVAYKEEKWQERVHGALLLKSLFFELTESTGPHEYQKVKHGVLLTRYLIEHPTEELSSLASLLGDLLERSPA